MSLPSVVSHTTDNNIQRGSDDGEIDSESGVTVLDCI